MSKVNEIVSKIREQINDEETREKVSTLLTDVAEEYNNLQESFSVVKNESVKRKEKIREILPKLNEQEDTIKELEQKADTSDLQTELEQLRGFKQDYLKQQKDNFISEFGKVAKHPKFEKAKKKFVLPEKADDEEGFDFGKIKDEDMEKNISVLNDLKELDYFTEDKEDPKPPVDGNRFNEKPPTEPNIKSRSDLRANMKKQLFEN